MSVGCNSGVGGWAGWGSIFKNNRACFLNRCGAAPARQWDLAHLTVLTVNQTDGLFFAVCGFGQLLVGGGGEAILITMPLRSLPAPHHRKQAHSNFGFFVNNRNLFDVHEWCQDKENESWPLFFSLPGHAPALSPPSYFKEASCSFDLSLPLCVPYLHFPLYGYRPHSVTCLLRFKHCGVWSPLCGCNLCHQTEQLTSKAGEAGAGRGGGTTNMKRGKWVRLRMIEKEKTEYPVDEKHWLEKPERNSQRAVMAGVLNLYLLLMHAVSPPFGWNCEITRSLTAAGMLRALVSALGQH